MCPLFTQEHIVASKILGWAPLEPVVHFAPARWAFHGLTALCAACVFHLLFTVYHQESFNRTVPFSEPVPMKSMEVFILTPRNDVGPPGLNLDDKAYKLFGCTD
jgi:hypothetical protein